jgi:surfeit locus 1 family protein
VHRPLTIRFANRLFKPSLLGTVLLVVGLVAFVNLGLWQLRRADEKQVLLDAVAQGQTQVVELTGAGSAALPRYQRVSAHGRFESDRQFLLDNMPSAHGRAGYRVLTPFVLEDGHRVLVDRGWLPLGAVRGELPDLTVAETPRAITGTLDELPRPGLRLQGAASESGGTWPQVVNFPEHATLEAALGTKLLEPILLLDADLPDGFEREWQTRIHFTPERHVGYAVQWFTFAFVAIVIYLLLNFKKAADEDGASG